MADPIIEKGFGCVWGIDSKIVGTGAGTLAPLEEDLGLTRQNEPCYNPADGSVIGETYYRKEALLRIRLYPSGPTMSDATTANQRVIEPGHEMTITDTTDPALANQWCVHEVGKSRRHSDKAYWEVTLRRWGDNVGYLGVQISDTIN